MRFDWDPKKERLNKKRHGLSFDVAVQVFNDPFCFTIPDRIVSEEERVWTIGRILTLVVVVVVHTLTDEHGEEVCRLISARRATREERNLYEESEIK
jgi:uncharacterized DUF497 family protein